MARGRLIWISTGLDAAVLSRSISNHCADGDSMAEGLAPEAGIGLQVQPNRGKRPTKNSVEIKAEGKRSGEWSVGSSGCADWRRTAVATSRACSAPETGASPPGGRGSWPYRYWNYHLPVLRGQTISPRRALRVVCFCPGGLKWPHAALQPASYRSDQTVAGVTLFAAAPKRASTRPN
ncbi:hypothetical protein N7462_002261 [Penicillium macrosclerotiorum]|uniref:uncharacterized protein n=1 Tax=Penicillium macrosclerotiorum TaxID=303699 RepID=UPI0025495529|nr:uncharacterized protein N7462_002261 [Penicillium macrosclerotiorum]KAJ5692838.1 hypothetical protein N7462_002261 [Penicillium macrosclerotiorum]